LASATAGSRWHFGQALGCATIKENSRTWTLKITKMVLTIKFVGIAVCNVSGGNLQILSANFKKQKVEKQSRESVVGTPEMPV